MSFINTMKSVLQNNYLGGGALGKLGLMGGIIPSILNAVLKKPEPEQQQFPWINPDLYKQFHQRQNQMGPQFQNPDESGWYDQFLQNRKKKNPYQF